MSELALDTRLTVLHFLFQNIHACIELHYINKVLPLPLLETVPGSPAYLVGLMNLAGNSVPVIDLSMRLGMQRVKPYSLDMPILLCCDGSQKTGIIIDEVLSLVNIEQAELQMSYEFEKKESPFLGIISIHSELSLLLNINSILAIHLTAETMNLNVDTNLLNQAKKIS